MALEKIKEILRKARAKKDEKKHIVDMDRFEENIQAKKMSSNERELLGYKEEERQAMIKKMVKRYRDKERDETWRGKKFNPISAPNIMKDNNNIFSNNENIFGNNENIFTKKTNLFNQPDLFFGK